MMDNLPDYISPENFCTECPFQFIPIKRDCVNLRNMKFPRVTAALDGLRAIQTTHWWGTTEASDTRFYESAARGLAEHSGYALNT